MVGFMVVGLSESQSLLCYGLPILRRKSISQMQQEPDAHQGRSKNAIIIQHFRVSNTYYLII